MVRISEAGHPARKARPSPKRSSRARGGSPTVTVEEWASGAGEPRATVFGGGRTMGVGLPGHMSRRFPTGAAAKARSTLDNVDVDTVMLSAQQRGSASRAARAETPEGIARGFRFIVGGALRNQRGLGVSRSRRRIELPGRRGLAGRKTCCISVEASTPSQRRAIRSECPLRTPVRPRADFCGLALEEGASHAQAALRRPFFLALRIEARGQGCSGLCCRSAGGSARRWWGRLARPVLGVPA